ncbi:MAG TPA: glycosyltransferase family 2 protein [Gammaproteobacteria bacterium]|jgi:glycosyltransferase involved in cell wall biosynthesis
MELSIASRTGAAASRTHAEAPRLTLVTPCFNEEAALPATAEKLVDLLIELKTSGLIAQDSRLCMVDDGSLDDTWQIIRSLSEARPECCGIRLSRNFGHQKALLAGLLSAPGDALISLDADLQDDPTVIREMLSAYHGGVDIVYGVREDRSADSWWKRAPAEAYYKLLRAIGIKIVHNHADYRLMSRRAVESLRDYREVNLFLRGLVSDLGFPHAVVAYARRARAAGETKYPLRRMLALAVDGITSFSAAPLRFISLLGLVIFTGSLFVSAWALWVRLFTDDAVPGWASSVLPIYFLGGIQLLSIAIVGEYVAKIYLETKARPRFLVQESCGMHADSSTVSRSGPVDP